MASVFLLVPNHSDAGKSEGSCKWARQERQETVQPLPKISGLSFSSLVAEREGKKKKRNLYNTACPDISSQAPSQLEAASVWSGAWVNVLLYLCTGFESCSCLVLSTKSTASTLLLISSKHEQTIGICLLYAIIFHMDTQGIRIWDGLRWDKSPISEKERLKHNSKNQLVINCCLTCQESLN